MIKRVYLGAASISCRCQNKRKISAALSFMHQMAPLESDTFVFFLFRKDESDFDVSEQKVTAFIEFNG